MNDMQKSKEFTIIKSLSTGVFLSVISRFLFDWWEEGIKRTNLIFDILDLKDKDNTIEVDLILKNYSGSLSRFKGIKLMAFLEDDLVASGPVNTNLFILKNEQALILEKIILDKHKESGFIESLNYKLIANLDGIDTDIKGFESNRNGTVYNPVHAEAIKGNV